MSSLLKLPIRIIGMLAPRGRLFEIFGRNQYRELLAESTVNVIRSKMTLPSDFNNDDLVIVYWYTHQKLQGLTYKSLNAVLWGEYRANQTILLELSAMLEVALKKLPDYRGTCWRTTKTDVHNTLPHVDGTSVTYLGFTSTSKVARRAVAGGTRVVLASVTGKFIGGISRFPGEAEVLFPPSTTFNVLTNRMVGGTRELILEQA